VPPDIIASLTQRAQALGLATLGCTDLPQTPELSRQLATWLAQGCHGDMAWMARNAARRDHPTAILAQARSLIAVALNYFTPYSQSRDTRRGRISRYAWGDDYHDLLLPKLRSLQATLHALAPDAESVAYVDTGPVLEKPWAARAGLGWQGKHTNLIDPRRGSWFFIGEIITTAVFTKDEGRSLAPRARTRDENASLCGKCTKCIEVCPTRAITGPYELDARRCISYLTIEHKGSIPVELRPLIGNHIYGCDLCQDICPWNRFATPTPEPGFQPRAGNLNPTLISLMTLTDEEFRQRFRKSPIKRIKRARFLRNVAVALGNSGDPAALPVLARAATDPEPLIREHVQWAIAEIERRHCD
jgi:epoxyqueuosine reductase